MPLPDYALVVGISRYPGIEDLSGPENDANEFFSWVTSQDGGGVDPANTKLILSSSFPPAPATQDERPAQDQIYAFFNWMDNLSQANNQKRLGLHAGRRLWMFFSGHGFAPSLEASGVLMANATVRQVRCIGAARWADQLYNGGLFDEVLLFQDACRSRIAAAELDALYLVLGDASAMQQRKRFYAFSAKDQKLSKEMPFPGGKVRGVFTATLMDGLRGAARDPVTGAINARTLKTYLQDNMSKWLSDADKNNPDIAQEPDVRDFDVLDIVSPPVAAPAAGPAGPAGAAPAQSDDMYSVTIHLPAAGLSVTLQDGAFQPLMTANPAEQTWSIKLRRGLYRLIVPGRPDTIFPVTGPGSGPAGAIDVNA
jgi:hypothetical protein